MNTLQWSEEFYGLMELRGIPAEEITPAEMEAAADAMTRGEEPVEAVNLILYARQFVAKRAQCSLHVHTAMSVWRGQETDETVQSRLDLMLN